MNRLSTVLVFLSVILLFNCGRRTTAPTTIYKEGLTIDSSIRELVMKNHKAEGALVSEMDVRMFENDKSNNKTMLTGADVPHNSYSQVAKDTLTIIFTNSFGGSSGLKIVKAKDDCRVFYGFSVRDEKGIFKLKLTDLVYETGLSVPCHYTLVLNKNEYATGETVYGYIESTSDDYYEKVKGKDVKMRVTYKGYFKALVLEG
jgi:hypothetical protein